MNVVQIPAKEIPVKGEYDVIVVGGGTAGVAAAISSAREGLTTLVVEQFGSLGGSQTLALVTPMMSNHIEGEPSNSGISEEINRRVCKYGNGLIANDGNSGWFDPQILKIVLEEMAAEAGCDILYHTTCVDIVREDKQLQYIIVHNKDGIFALKAKCFIDCTGDADVAYMAGVPTESGDKDGINQAVSLRFQMTNIDLDVFGEYLEKIGQNKNTRFPWIHTASVPDAEWALNELFQQKYKEGILTEEDTRYFQVFSIPGRPKDLAFNCPELGRQRNVIESKFLTQKQIEGKKAIHRLTGFLKEWVPGFKDAYVCTIAPMIGIRESRRIQAEYQLVKEDILQYKKFEDGIVRSNYPIDIHGEKLDVHIVQIGELYYEIPYRSLVPIGIDNLLVAGRCIGSDFIAQSAIRIQPTCRAMGEASGIAAKLSITNNVAFREIEGQKVREQMRERGAAI